MHRAVVLLLVVSSLVYAGQALMGEVIHVADGDTLTLLAGGERITVHLAGVDAPESDQPFGNKARRCLGELSLGETARVIETSRDSHGTLVGHAYVGDLDVNAAVVEQGCAWVDLTRRHNLELLGIETRARRQKRGLWANQGVISPWEWRGGKRTITRNSGSVHGLVVGNWRTHVYHLPGCPGYGQVAEHDRVLFITAQAAEADGYRKAVSCP